MTRYRLKKDLPILKTGAIFELRDEDGYKWLSNNDTDAAYEIDSIDDFGEWFEEIKESGWWKPKNGVDYYYARDDGVIISRDGLLSLSNNDDARFSIGNCFKTKDAAERYRDYLEAITTVRQDEGVLTPEQAAENGYAYYIHAHYVMGLRVHGVDSDYISVGAVLFDTREHAQASLDNHPDEWKIIANYDWSRE